jgi:hypothetical protein
MLTVANSHLMRKIAFEGGKPVMEKLIFVSPTLPSLYSLCFRHFVLTHFGKSQNSFAKGRGPHVLYYLFIKLLFGKSQNSFAIEKVGPICQLSLSITLCGKLTSHFETRRRLCGKLTSHFETRRRLCGKLTSHFETRRRLALSSFSAHLLFDHSIKSKLIPVVGS